MHGDKLYIFDEAWNPIDTVDTVEQAVVKLLKLLGSKENIEQSLSQKKIRIIIGRQAEIKDALRIYNA